ncbi:DNA repair protein REV1 [Phymastichus coffea]|uniref:DNA repair protein REV1 n=1 Tax=Phymastichus coffea TaxID=108790 RepID=UPI00273BE6CE|nr:DNA repair protein REV1 [Phymastichus coffea]
MMAHGGIYHHYLRSQSTTHMIASNLPYSKIVAYRKAQRPLPLCKPEWITDSIKAGKLLDHKNYLLYSQCTETQPAIFSHFKKNRLSQTVQPEPISTNSKVFSKTVISKPKEEQSPSISHPIIPGSAIANCTKNPEFLTEFYNNSRLHHISTMGTMFKEYITDLRDKHDGRFPGLEFLKKQSIERHKAGPSARQDYIESDEELFDEELPSDLQNQKPITNKNPIIMHIDMDCFFVSVGLRKNPELRGFPIAVAHAKGNKISDNPSEYGSMSEVASCSYEARKAGVRNGMFLGKALKLCPDLKVIRYDFEGYKEVSYTLYDTVASYTLDIEAVSCDEMYADCTKILQESKLSPLDFATIIRSEIREKTGCPVSTGFGHNKLQSRLATKKAKPDGQYFLTDDTVMSFIRTLSVKDLPGVGWSTSSKLAEMNIEICADLEALPLYDLQKEFGKKNGQQLYDMCRGIDNTKLSLEHIRKSVSAEVNYGIRFENTAAAHEFLKKLSEEISDRLKKINSKGKCVTLKVLFRAKDAPNEPRKFMGHGVCDAFNKSKNFIASTDDPITIEREVVHLWNQFQQNPEDARGIGIQITKLESTKNKASGSTIFKFINNMKAAVSNDKPVNHITVPYTKKQSTKCSLMEFFQPENKNNSKDSYLQLQDYNKVSSNVESCSNLNEIQLDDNVLDNIMKGDKVTEIAKHTNVKTCLSNKITVSKENQFSKELNFEDEIKDDSSNEKLKWPNSNNTDLNIDNHIESEELKFDDDELNEVLGNVKNEVFFRREDSNTDDINIRLQPILESDYDSDNSNQCQISKRTNGQQTKISSQLRQTKQSQFFKQIKPFSSSRVSKVKLPELQEIDMQVLIELPEDIRNEILNEYKEKKNENMEDENKDFRTSEPLILNNNIQTNTNINIEDISFSQIDPEFLAALPNDMKNEVKHYCDAQRKVKKLQIEDKRTNNGWYIFKNDEKPQKGITKSKRGRPKLADKVVKNKEKKAVASTSHNKFAKESEPSSSNIKVDLQDKNKKNQLSKETSVTNKSFYFDNSQVNSQHNEMLSNLVSCLLELPIAQHQVMQWIRSSSNVNDVDFLSLTTYLGTLPRKHRLADLHILMKCLHRCISETKSCIWHDTYKKIVIHVQIRMRQEYTYDLMIPSEVECDRCHTSIL